MFRVQNPRLLPFAGAGISVHFLEVDVVVPDQDFGGFVVPGFAVEDSSTKIGLDFGGGLLYNLNGRASLLSEVWYSLVNDVNQLSLEVGLVWHFASQ
jgi:opacity protein-like surface antigen